MLTEPAFGQTHTDESCQGGCLQKSTVGWLHALEHLQGLGNKQLTDRTQHVALTFQLTDTDGYQCGNGIAHHRHVEIAEQALWQRGQLEGEGGYLVPTADDACQGTHRQDGH